MKSNGWFRSDRSLSRLRAAIAGLLLVAGVWACVAVTTTRRAVPAVKGFAWKRGNPSMATLASKRALFGTNESRGLYTPAVEEFLKRAYPSDDVSPTRRSRRGTGGPR
jgi:hypothetical protein